MMERTVLFYDFHRQYRMPRSQNVLRLGQNRSLGPTGPNRLGDVSIDQRLLPKATRPLLSKPDGSIDKSKYEWFLYLQIPNRLNGQLTLPEVIRYRALEDDLVKPEIWKNQKGSLVEGTQQPNISEDPKRLIPRMADELTLRLHEVSHYLERSDTRCPSSEHLAQIAA